MKRITGLNLVLLLTLALSSPAMPADRPGSLVIIAGTTVQHIGGSRYITLFGSPFDDRRLYMTALYIRVDNGAPVRLPEEAGSGYEPHLLPCDFTGDGNEEVLITASTGGSGGIVNGLICRIGADGGVSIVFDTGQGVMTPVSGRFLDGYRASVSVLDTTVVINLIARKEYYDQLGVYDSGRPTGAWEPWSDPYGLILPEDADGDSVCELACWQSVSGAAHVDRIAIIKSVLSWAGTGWNITGLEISAQGDARIE